VVCVDELGPVTPRTFPPAPGWSPDGRRIKAPLEYSRGPDKAWIFGALRVEDGKSLTFTSRSRNSKSYLRLLQKIERAIPKGLIYLIADNLKTHKSAMVREWLEKHPRIEHAFIPKGAAWLNLMRRGGVCSGGRRWPGWISPTVTRSVRRRGSPPGN